MNVNSLIRLMKFEYALIRMLFFRVIFERLTNTIMAAIAGFGSVYFSTLASNGTYAILPGVDDYSRVQSMILFAFLYAETIMANWQYTTNKAGRMELIFNSSQPPLLIIFVKNLASASITLASMITLYFLPLGWFGLLAAYSPGFWLAAGATLCLCSTVMTFNAVFEFQFKQVKAVTALVNLVLPYLAMRDAKHLPATYGFVPYFNDAKFLSLGNNYGLADVAWLLLTTIVTGLFFLFLAQFVVRRIRQTASVYLE